MKSRRGRFLSDRHEVERPRQCHQHEDRRHRVYGHHGHTPPGRARQATHHPKDRRADRRRLGEREHESDDGREEDVQVQRCELVRADGNTVQLAATYVITPAGGGDARSAVFTATPRPWDGGDPAAIIGLMREAAGELADAIAAAVEK